MKLDKKTRVKKLIEALKSAYPDAHCALIHSNPFELLVATILSAQCTDARVNIVTADLFRKYRKPADYVAVEKEELELDIRSTGFYRNKAKNLRGASEKIISDFDGEVPRTMDELLTLPGVARKTANVVLGNAFAITSGIVVDTHVKRISNRLGLTKETNPVKVERDLEKIVPKEDWVMFSHWLISLGRGPCNAKKPTCYDCPCSELCPRIGVDESFFEPPQEKKVS